MNLARNQLTDTMRLFFFIINFVEKPLKTIDTDFEKNTKRHKFFFFFVQDIPKVTCICHQTSDHIKGKDI